MNGVKTARSELESNWLAISFMSTLARAEQPTQQQYAELEGVMRLVAQHLGEHTEASAGVVALAAGGRRTAVRWVKPPDAAGRVDPFPKERLADLDFSKEEIGLATRLRTPVLAKADVVGFLEFSKSDGSTHFLSPDQQLLRVVAGWLGLLQQREVLSMCAVDLQKNQQALLGYAIGGSRWNSMLHDIWSATEDAQIKGPALCELGLGLISSRIPNTAGLLSIRNYDSVPIEVAHTLDQRTFEVFRGVV